MPEINFTCSKCGAEIEADESIAGSVAQCPNCNSTVMIPMPGIKEGMKIAGYETVRRLGVGGMGEVWLATQTAMDRKVALKILSPALTTNTQFVDRFLKEVKNAAKLEHSNIVTAFDAGVDGIVYYLAMSYVDGVLLEDLLKVNKIIPENEALRIVRCIAEALNYAWTDFHIIHRDIKPSNIMLDSKKTPKLMDMGISKSISEEKGLTMTGMALGTPYYMSPEQARADVDIDCRSDIYSLGATLYHLVTGEVPYDGNSSVGILTKHITDPFPSPQNKNPKLSDACSALLEVMMAKSPDDRQNDWNAVIEDIDLVIAGKLPRTKRPDANATLVMRKINSDVQSSDGRTTVMPQIMTVKGQRKKNSMPLMIAATAAIILVALIIWFVMMNNSNKSALAEKEKSRIEQESRQKAEAVEIRLTKENATKIPEKVSAGTNKQVPVALGNSVKAVATLKREGKVPEGFEILKQPTSDSDGWASEIRHKTTGIEMVYVVPGEFMMGSPLKEARRCDDETLHKVKLTKPYYIGKYEVTQGQWEKIMGDKSNLSYFKGVNLPVENVSVDTCRKFCDNLGAGFRYPTEAEWEYAARGGNKSHAYINSGSDYLDEVGWYYGNSENKTHDVGMKKPNELGIYDMSGNVWELCSDWKGDYTSGSVTDPTGALTGPCRVYRGGSWGDGNGGCRSAIRSKFPPEFLWSKSAGLRLAMDIHLQDMPISQGILKSENSTSGTPKEKSGPKEKDGEGVNKQMSIELGDGVKMEFVLVQPGKFMMGFKGSQHEVTLTKPFWIGKFEVTQEQYQRVMGINPSRTKDLCKDAPVGSVSWLNAVDFCKKLSEKEGDSLPKGYVFRLPTEAEWEFAASGGQNSQGFIYSGSNTANEVGWFNVNSENKTNPVGKKKANELGLYDMSGNVWEWCNDWFGEYPKKPEMDPLGPKTGSIQVLRSGSWGNDPFSGRIASRHSAAPVECGGALGFRLTLGYPLQDIPVSPDKVESVKTVPETLKEKSGPKEKDGEEVNKQMSIDLGGGVKMEFVFVQHGKFILGDKGDQNEVTLSKSFWIGKFEVTQEQYEEIMGINPSFYKDSGKNAPVECVSWFDAVEFCKRLTEKADKSPSKGYVFRLPTSVEWEYAARGGQKSKGFEYSGSNILSEVASKGKSYTVGTKKPNELGIHDMSGNVSEWCQDWAEGWYIGRPVTDPSGPPSGLKRIFRGGSIISPAEQCRNAYRNATEPENRSRIGGFRVVLTAP